MAGWLGDEWLHATSDVVVASVRGLFLHTFPDTGLDAVDLTNGHTCRELRKRLAAYTEVVVVQVVEVPHLLMYLRDLPNLEALELWIPPPSQTRRGMIAWEPDLFNATVIVGCAKLNRVVLRFMDILDDPELLERAVQCICILRCLLPRYGAVELEVRAGRTGDSFTGAGYSMHEMPEPYLTRMFNPLSPLHDVPDLVDFL